MPDPRLAFPKAVSYGVGMCNRPGIAAAAVVASLLVGTSVWAGTKSIQGTLVGMDGKPIAGAEIRADRLDAKTERTVTQTDAQGHYTFRALPAGAYAVTAVVKSVAKSRAMVRTRDDGWAKVDFDLRTRPDSPNIKKKYVWVKGEPGSHIGGRWIEVDQANQPTTSAVDVVGTDDVRRMQRDMRINNNVAMPGR